LIESLGGCAELEVDEGKWREVTVESGKFLQLQGEFRENFVEGNALSVRF
jgi:hypothetical protein